MTTTWQQILESDVFGVNELDWRCDVAERLEAGGGRTNDPQEAGESRDEMIWTIRAVNAGDCYAEQIYGQSEAPRFDSRAEAEAEAEALLPGAMEVAPGVEFIVDEWEGDI